ncbi:hypothetical protein A3Q56_07460 [Intoshia linei]|uniref:E3 ubiquitin-protein ligase RNF10 n=1 Tax=Intoshia linei TaxID=1819745 RepID=A0A177ATY5_9BILA|nr:hypothetical protein A3Q56_07460 [Intoshia linei]
MENDNINVKNEFNKITDFISKNSTSYCKIHENDAFLSSSCKFYIYPAVDINNENMASNRHLDLHKDLDFKDWDLICLVDYYTNELTPCPICLDDLVAPRITRCGHIFCTVCIYNLNDFNFGNYFTCPVCYTLININNCKM